MHFALPSPSTRLVAALRRSIAGTTIALVCALTLAIGAAPAVAKSAPKPGPTLVDIRIPAVKGPIDDRWLPGYTGGPRAMVLLPAGYNPKKNYPLLVLLEGITSNYKMWSQAGIGQIAKTAGGLNAIIVMPEGGNGWYADWWNRGRRGGPSWETYILDDLLPFVLKKYPIRPERRWHALAGESMGGMGSAYFGGRLPGFFGSVAVLSGLADTQLIPGATTLESYLLAVPRRPEKHAPVPIDFQAVYGPEYGFYANGHNPTKLAANLADTRLYTLHGRQWIPYSIYGEPFKAQEADGLGEALILRPAMTNFSRSLRAATIPHVFKVHKGAHSWPNFRQELRIRHRVEPLRPHRGESIELGQ